MSQVVNNCGKGLQNKPGISENPVSDASVCVGICPQSADWYLPRQVPRTELSVPTESWGLIGCETAWGTLCSGLFRHTRACLVNGRLQLPHLSNGGQDEYPAAIGTSLLVQWLRPPMLPMQGAWIWSLVRALRAHMPCGTAKKKKSTCCMWLQEWLNLNWHGVSTERVPIRNHPFPLPKLRRRS